MSYKTTTLRISVSSNYGKWKYLWRMFVFEISTEKCCKSDCRNIFIDWSLIVAIWIKIIWWKWITSKLVWLYLPENWIFKPWKINLTVWKVGNLSWTDRRIALWQLFSIPDPESGLCQHEVIRFVWSALENGFTDWIRNVQVSMQNAHLPGSGN